MKNLFLILLSLATVAAAAQSRQTQDFDAGWKFQLGNDSLAKNITYNDAKWRSLNVPHDWSIEGKFDEKNPTLQAEGGLPAGIGWYRKTFTLPAASKGKNISIVFDGVQHNSEVWINGHYLGKRPNGYISFEYELTSYLKFGGKNVLSVKVNNSDQPNSRWYTGSGIYRNVWLVTSAKTHIAPWGVAINTPRVSVAQAEVHVLTRVDNVPGVKNIEAKTYIYDAAGQLVAQTRGPIDGPDNVNGADQSLTIAKPQLWSVDKPYLYTVKVTLVDAKGKVIDEVTNKAGIRWFDFDANKGFSLNGEPMKIKGVCLHHDAGALGAAVYTRAIERQLQIMKDMGVNAIRTSHNPPTPELLDLCDRMGLLVMDEAFDMWKKKKNKNDYHNDWDQWHTRDLQDQVIRDRNHPSVFLWSIGNEIREQFDSTGISITRELVNTVKKLDSTRPVISALSEWNPEKNFLYKSGALDLVGLNYHHEVYADFQKHYPGQKFIGTEQTSALMTRGHYDMPSDTTMFWPADSKTKYVTVNPDYTVSAYDNVAAYWGSTHETTWKLIKKYDFLSGMFVWTGFDYIGEPTPYPWPARSSYFGIVDLAGFPKDIYYMYQSEWTSKPVLHLLPHWNWKAGQMVDVLAYYNQADEVELFLNGRSLGIKKKQGEDLHVKWKVKFEPGVLKAVSRKAGQTVLTTQVLTAGEPYQIKLSADRSTIKAGGKDLSYVTISILDKDGNVVPDANNLINFKVTGAGLLKGMDNGYQADLTPFTSSSRKAFNGLALGIVGSVAKQGAISIFATAPGLKSANLTLKSR